MNKQVTDQKEESTDKDSEIIAMRDLLEAGVHFGHQTRRWNPRMKKYIFTARNGIHVIDLQQTIPLIHEAYAFIKETVKKGGTVLFVGTKKQAQDAVMSEALRCKQFYISSRWLGGFLTNNGTIHLSINKLKKYTKEEAEGMLESLSKKELARKTKRYQRLKNYLDGVKDMVRLPEILFVIDTNKEHLAIKEAKRKGIKIVGVVDTNANPEDVDYPIPANDDAIRAIKLLCSVCANAVIAGQSEQVAYANKKETETAVKAAKEKEEKIEETTKK
ncbi:MAG: 30S ribosomal protein S2 [bacterium]